MAAATVIHFGSDDRYCVPALRRAGYEVRESDCLERLKRDLERDDKVDAVIVSGVEPRCAENAAVLVRCYSGAPLILFRPSDVALDESRFDRVFSPFVPEPNWLFETAVVVMQSRELRSASERLRQESEAVRAESRRQVLRVNAG